MVARVETRLQPEEAVLHVHMTAIPFFTSQKLLLISSSGSEQPDVSQKWVCISHSELSVSSESDEF